MARGISIAEGTALRGEKYDGPAVFGEGAGEGPLSEMEVEGDPTPPCSEVLPHRKNEVSLEPGDLGLLVSSLRSDIDGERLRKGTSGRFRFAGIVGDEEAAIADAVRRCGGLSWLGWVLFTEDSLHTLAWLGFGLKGEDG